MPTNSLVLPFAVPVKERVKAFTPSMEFAAILFLTELGRRKRGLLDTEPKRTLFVSKMHYPLWAVPCKTGHIILDGLGVLSTSIKAISIPDVRQFIDDIERGIPIREQFRSALAKHEQGFKSFAKISEVQINALINDAELLSAMVEYVKEASARDLAANDAVALLPSTVDGETALETANQVSNLFQQEQSQIRALEYARNLLNETLGFHEHMILKEVESVRDVFEAEVARFRPAVEKKIGYLLKERDARIAKMNRATQSELKGKDRERERLERELQRLELNKADYSRRRERSRKRRDKIGETRWEHRIKVYENRIAETKSRLHAVSEFIEKTRRQVDADAERLKFGYQTLIDQERRKIMDIEAQRDSSLEAKQAETEKLRFAASGISRQIDELLEQKRQREEDLLGLVASMQLDDVTLICLPFYMASYRAGKKIQFKVFPPFHVTSPEGIVKTLKKTMSLRQASRLKLFLRPRSSDLTKMLDSTIEEKIKSDKAFKKNLLQAAATYNLLEKQNLREMLTKGVGELKAEGWVNQTRGDALIRTYA